MRVSGMAKGAAIALASFCFGCVSTSDEQSVALQPGQFPAIGVVDERFQSYNVEMAEVVGARFWAPYNADGSVPADRYQARTPLDLRGEVRLQNLARALGPAYMRLSGTWANGTYFQDDDRAPPATAPTDGVLTREQWAGVVHFADVVDAEIVTSFAADAAARDTDGVWSPDRARRLIRYTRSLGGNIAAIETLNEPTLGPGSRLPPGYDAADFAQDNVALSNLIEQEAPGTLLVGPSAANETGDYLPRRFVPPLDTENLLSAEPRTRFDVFSYHVYTSTSRRCRQSDVIAADGLTEEWLGVTERVHNHYAALRDRFTPDAPIWVTEIGEASCGGDPWAATFVDTFRYVDNAGRLAKLGAAAFFHNTLAASDYALIDDRTLEPRPSYWAAVLWRRLMGTTVLDAGAWQPGLHLYAHCLRGEAGGVALIAINLDQANSASIRLPVGAQRYTLSADDLESVHVRLNGDVLTMADDELPDLAAAEIRAGAALLQPATITFFALPQAANAACH